MGRVLSRTPAAVFLNNTERILRTYGREKMVDALNVVVHEIAEYQRAIELSQRIEKKILENEAKVCQHRV